MIEAQTDPDTIPDDAECDSCGHRYEEHDAKGCGRICTCAYFIPPYPDDTSNEPTSRAEAEQP